MAYVSERPCYDKRFRDRGNFFLTLLSRVISLLFNRFALETIGPQPFLTDLGSVLSRLRAYILPVRTSCLAKKIYVHGV